jgi:hypothetical protein
MEATWEDGHYYWATIMKVNGDGTFDVSFDDGDSKTSVPTTEIRHRTGGY